METRIFWPRRMSRDFEKTLPLELQEYIEAERRAVRAATIAEMRLGKVFLGASHLGVGPEPSSAGPTNSNDEVVAEAHPDKPEAPLQPQFEPQQRQAPRGLGRQLVSQVVDTIKPGTVVTTTDLRSAVFETSAVRLSFQTVRRAMEVLCDMRRLEKIPHTEGYRILQKLTAVKS